MYLRSMKHITIEADEKDVEILRCCIDDHIYLYEGEQYERLMRLFVDLAFVEFK